MGEFSGVQNREEGRFLGRIQRIPGVFESLEFLKFLITDGGIRIGFAFSTRIRLRSKSCSALTPPRTHPRERQNADRGGAKASYWSGDERGAGENVDYAGRRSIELEEDGRNPNIDRDGHLDLGEGVCQESGEGLRDRHFG